jgi:Domain of unknown function (DUF397)
MDLSDVAWRKSSRSHEDGDQCVEIASIVELIAVRDSKDPGGPVLVLSHREFRCLVDTLRDPEREIG